ncbi:uncharacterized protein EDB91DRAFT_1247408 [Suillus paluster]|uniref:uncharacterized protein n=1 Tax=Suillus paluster TaxID=48578 RepID=UPI001B879026|nr:uncharacterized protein EDB91DRAFT_1247408 [Suillus paluster]KAG1743327.1 hypothetical protein EDB91DRAFT_1247408 [Suillus paluster]
MTTTTSRSTHLVDAAMVTDSHSFIITRTLVDAAVSTEEVEVSEATERYQAGDRWKTLDAIPCIKGGITALVASLGGTLHAPTHTGFPWMTLPKELARLGYVLVNYPDETLVPGEKRPTLSRSKGICDMTVHHRHSLINALKTGTLTIQEVTSGAARTRLTTSNDPVIIGEAPPPRSVHSRGRRVFANGRIDRKGLPRVVLPPALPTPRRPIQVSVEITQPPPSLASRAVHKASQPSATDTKDLILSIASVDGSASGSEYHTADDENDFLVEESQVSEGDSYPAKRLTRSYTQLSESESCTQVSESDSRPTKRFRLTRSRAF